MFKWKTKTKISNCTLLSVCTYEHKNYALSPLVDASCKALRWVVHTLESCNAASAIYSFLFFDSIVQWVDVMWDSYNAADCRGTRNH